MERLTVKDLDKTCDEPWELCGMALNCRKTSYQEGGCFNGCHIIKMIQKLAEYEDLEEQGKLLKLPVAKGDKVYYIYDGQIEESEVVEISDSRIWIDGTYFDYEDLGKTVYISKEEAENAMNKADAEWKEHLSRRFCQVE